jgi:hypothetical protein
MKFLPAKFAVLIVSLYVVFFFIAGVFFTVSAQTNTPTPNSPMPTVAIGEPNWVFDATVTQVGKNAERARQLIYWTLTHGVLFNAPIVRQTWIITRNIAYLLTAFVIIGLAIHLVLSRKSIGPTFTGISFGYDRVSLATIVFRVTMILLFITFAYVLVLGLIQLSEIMSQFFIKQLGGSDLFNIVFSGGNVEENYDFVGYKNADLLEMDMVNTSLLLVKITSFTYNFMSVILIVRQIILLFLLVLSPFLAILLPFIFIRNTGYIWIGEFFRWLFYGPLFALFIAVLARIWKSGIPYSFDFTRAQNGEMVYKTGINILYGGPAQVLSPTNTSNYVDTYAEYIIGLIMLWVAILLPWFLLRIFRDYCCDILQKNNALLTQMLRSIHPNQPPPTPPPATPTPIQQNVFADKLKIPMENIQTSTQEMTRQEAVSREQIVKQMKENNTDLLRTIDIQRAFNLQMSSLRDVAKAETNKEVNKSVTNTLSQLQNPYKAPSSADKEQFELLRNELAQRAGKGDKEARQVLQASTPQATHVPQTTTDATTEMLKKALEEPNRPVVITATASVEAPQLLSAHVVRSVAQTTHKSEKEVESLLKLVPLARGPKAEQIKQLSEQTGIQEDQVEIILDTYHTEQKKASSQVKQTTGVSIEEYEEIRKMWTDHYRKSEVPVTDKVKSRSDWIGDDITKLTNTLNLMIAPSVKDRQRGYEQLQNLLPFMLLGGFNDVEVLTYVKAKLEAAKMVQDELSKTSQTAIDEKAEDLLFVPSVGPKAQAEQKTMQQEKTMELPENNKDVQNKMPE